MCSPSVFGDCADRLRVHDPDLQWYRRNAGTVGKKHGATVANVAARFIMQQPAVGAVIVGARLGKSSHIAENSRMFDFRLDSDDVLLISTAVSALNPVPGDCGDEVSTASLHCSQPLATLRPP